MERSSWDRIAVRLSAVSLGMVLVPALIEAAALDPREIGRWSRPIAAGLRLALLNALPYLTAAVSFASLAWVARRAALEADPPAPRGSLPLALLALAAAGMAAFSARSVSDLLLTGRVHALTGGKVQLGNGGPLAPRFPGKPVALEELDSRADLLLPARPAPWDARITWAGARTESARPSGGAVELIAAGSVRDVTDRFRSLAPGETRIFSESLRVGPEPARVRLRLRRAYVPPASFFDVDQGVESRGIAIDAGGGDQAYRFAPRPGPGSPEAHFLAVEGRHAGGYSVVVVSGTQWRRHDLRELIARGGDLELVLEGPSAPPWEARLVGDGPQSEPVALSLFTAEPAEGFLCLRYRLSAIEWGSLAPAAVVGVALTYRGPAGPFRLGIRRARAVAPGDPPSGYALAAIASADPEALPTPLIAAGSPATSGAWTGNLFAIRLAAAALGAIAAIGFASFGSFLMARPLAFLAAAMSGPIAAFALEAALPLVADHRPEHLPAALAALALATAAAARRTLRTSGGASAIPAEAASPPAGRLEWVDGLKAVAIVGIVAIHVTADPAGLPFALHPEERRLPALVARAFATGLNYPIFLLASFFLLARGLDARPRGYGSTIASRLRRLAPPFALWSLFYLAFRHVKAYAFGYSEAYRRELASGDSWLGYVLLGDAQYHLHYLPLLMALTLLYPLFRLGRRWPVALAVLVVSLSVWPLLDGLAYRHIDAPETRAYVFRLTKIAAYTGYGFLAFALWRLGSAELGPRARAAVVGGAVIAAVASLVLLISQAADVAEAGRWLTPDLPAHLARYALPAALFTLFAALGARTSWPRWMVTAGTWSFGMYLVHPVFLDLLEIAERNTGLAPAVAAAVNLVGALAGSALVVAALSRVPSLRWTVGLERRRVP